MSMVRFCEIILATDLKWYVILGDWEYAYHKHECSVYGGFTTEEKAIEEVHSHTNPGGYFTDSRGTVTPEEIWKGARNEKRN